MSTPGISDATGGVRFIEMPMAAGVGGGSLQAAAASAKGEMTSAGSNRDIMGSESVFTSLARSCRAAQRVEAFRTRSRCACFSHWGRRGPYQPKEAVVHRTG